VSALPVAFVAGLLSFVTPCILPLVPGYLSAVSGTHVGAGGRRVLLASLPFVVGFTAVFVALGALVGAAGGLGSETAKQVAGLVLVVFGFAFMGLLPFPFLERLVAPGLVEDARRSGSSLLLGGAFAVCAAPCVGPFLASALALAGARGEAAEGSLLLFAYSAGLALPFLIAGFAVGTVTATLRRFGRFLPVLEVATGALVVLIGVLVFLNEFASLNQYFNFIEELNAV